MDKPVSHRPPPTANVITKEEAEYALDREEFDRLMQRRGNDTILLWWHETTLNLARRGYSVSRETLRAELGPSTPGDPRR